METIDYRGYEIEIHQDDMCQNPNDMGDNSLGFLVYDHSQFYIQVDGCDPQDVFNAMQRGETTVPFKTAYSKETRQYKFFPVYAYIHSGVALSLGRTGYPFNDRWDVSFKGFLLINTYQYDNPDKHQEIAESYIKEWNDYLSGNVWGFNIESDDGCNDSCWGFVGDKEYCISEAKACIDSHINWKRKEHFAQLKMWVKNHVPLYVREMNQYAAI